MDNYHRVLIYLVGLVECRLDWRGTERKDDSVSNTGAQIYSKYVLHLFSTSMTADISADPSEVSVKESHQVGLHCQIIKSQEQLGGWDAGSYTVLAVSFFFFPWLWFGHTEIIAPQGQRSTSIKILQDAIVPTQIKKNFPKNGGIKIITWRRIKGKRNRKYNEDWNYKVKRLVNLETSVSYGSHLFPGKF